MANYRVYPISMAIIKAFADLIGNDKCVDESMRCRFPLGTDASGAISGCFGVEL